VENETEVMQHVLKML